MAGRHGFEEQLMGLHQNLLKMGSLVEEAISLSVKSLADRDIVLAEKVIQQDDMIDKLYLQLENDCFRLIALQQPMAIDLRRIATVLKVVTDLERIADHGVNIAKATIRLKKEVYAKPLIDIPRMASLAQSMVRKAITAYVDRDIEKCYQLSKDDHEVDSLYKHIYNELIDIMQSKPNMVYQGTQLLFVAHYLERIADHATNLGEWVIYLVTGKLEELND